MGCVSSVFQFGSYLVQEGAEVNEEQKEESTSEKDGVPVPSSPSQDTVVTTASSGGDKVQESPTKAEAPLAKEEEFTQQASPVEEDLKEPKQEEEEAKTGEVEAPEPEVKELQRVNETKLEKEKTVDTSGVTTEKTVYTQMSESVTIQETKGPAVDPFASSQKTVFPPFSKSWHENKPQATESQSSPSYVHSVKVTESGPSSPSSPVSVKSDAPAPEKTQVVHELSESESEKIPSEPEKGEVSIKSEVVEVATDVAESLSDSHPETEKLEVQSSSLAKEQKEHVDQETSGNEAEVVYEEEVVDDSERTDVEGAVVKIQAGIRGYLTRKALKESRKDGPLMQSEIGGASVQTTSKQEEIPAEEPPVSDSREQAITDNSTKELEEEEDAAVKIQAVYRGYRTRKQLDEMSNEPCDEEVETLNTSAKKKTESPVQERRSPPDRSPVTVTENFVPILKAQITITPPSSPTLKHQHSLPSEAEPKDSKSSAIPETSGNTDETSHLGLSDDSGDGLNKKQAATKIQAAFRGYQVRKVSRKEAPGSVKGISETKESTDMDIAVESNVPEDVDHESSPLLRNSPSPPLDPDNEEDTLEDSTADDVEEIPNVEWQTSELYADDSTSKHLHEPDGSKTETMTEVTAPVEDSPKTVPMSSEQVILSTAKITLESHGSPLPTTEEDQQMQSDQ